MGAGNAFYGRDKRKVMGSNIQSWQLLSLFASKIRSKNEHKAQICSRLHDRMDKDKVSAYL